MYVETKVVRILWEENFLDHAMTLFISKHIGWI